VNGTEDISEFSIRHSVFVAANSTLTMHFSSICKFQNGSIDGMVRITYNAHKYEKMCSFNNSNENERVNANVDP